MSPKWIPISLEFLQLFMAYTLTLKNFQLVGGEQGLFTFHPSAILP
jgi:hypothetical protein